MIREYSRNKCQFTEMVSENGLRDESAAQVGQLQFDFIGEFDRLRIAVFVDVVRQSGKIQNEFFRIAAR